MLLPARQDDGDDLTASDPETPTDEGTAGPETHGERVQAGVARAALLDHLLRLPVVAEALSELPSEEGPLERQDPAGDPMDQALSRARRRVAAHALRVQAMAGVAQDIGVGWIGPWLPEFLEAAESFRGAIKNEAIGSCALVDPSLAPARWAVNSWRLDAEHSPWRRHDYTMRLLAALLPQAEPTWKGQAPDWIEVFAILVEHACERVPWTREVIGVDRAWPFLLRNRFVYDLERGDDPEIIHALVDEWAAICHATIELYTRPPLPRGRIPDNSGLDAKGRPREGRRDKVRRWIGWYVDKEIHWVPRIDILRSAFPLAEDPTERSSELNRHIREAKRLLALPLPLEPSQPIRVWRLLQTYRPDLEALTSGG